MTRKIKFRAWDKVQRKMLDWNSLLCNAEGLAHALQNVGAEEPHGNWTAMQYTGFEDKNSREIYEGDFVRWTNTFFDGGKLVIIEPVAWQKQILFPGNLGRTEVVGNIYENPELLNQTAHQGRNGGQ